MNACGQEKRLSWPIGACSLLIPIEDYSGKCGRCGWSIEDHEYLNVEPENCECIACIVLN